MAENLNPKPKITLRACVVGVYLFSVPAFAYSGPLGLTFIPQITGALLLAYAIIDGLSSLRITIPKEIGLYGLFGLYAVITFYFGADMDADRILKLGTLIKVVIATLASAQLIKDEDDLITALQIFVFSILFVFYLNMEELQYLRIAGRITEADRFAGTLANANTAAIFSLTIIWASIFLLLRSKKGFLRTLFLIPIGLSSLIIYYSGSKAGLLGIGLFVFFVARLMYIRQHSSFYKKILVIMISVLLIILVGYFIYMSPFFSRMEQLVYMASTSDTERYDLALEAINVWLMNGKTFLIGVGYDNFRSFSYLQTYSHNTPLELLASNGIIGLFLFMGFFFLLFRRFLFLYRQIFSQELRSILFSVLIFLSIFSFFMISAVLQDSRELMPILGCLAAFGQFHVRLIRQSQENELTTSVI